MYYYFQSEKDRLARKRTREASKGVGKPRIGGPFELVDQDGQKFTSEDLKGKFSLVRTTLSVKTQERRVADVVRPDILRLLTLSRHLP